METVVVTDYTIKVWRYQRSNQKSLTEEGLIIQWLKENERKTNNGQQNTTQETNDRATRLQLKVESELRYARRGSS